jgi:acetyl esterase/lipase
VESRQRPAYRPGVRGNDEVLLERGVPYGHGKLLDVYRPADSAGRGPVPVVLLWHGVGVDERDVLEPLARATAGHGVVVVVPDWRSDAPDGGGAHLLASLAFTRDHAGDLGGAGERAIVLAGWSRGGRCAAAIGVRPGGVDGWRPSPAWGRPTPGRPPRPGPRRWRT